jgi:hypothetical protein
VSLDPEWEVTLARSAGMEPIGLLPYDFTLSPIFNRPGSFSMTLPLDAKVAYKVEKLATCVVCQRNGVVVWSGPIVAVARAPAAMTMTISALGWLDELNHRYVRADEEAALVFVDVKGGDIVRSLIEAANAQKTTDQVVAPTHLSFYQAFDSQVRTRSYKRGQSYGQAIQELVDVENGLDLLVNPQTRAVSTHDPTFFADRQNVVFGYGAAPFNLADAPQLDDGTSVANRVTAVGANGVAIPADDANAIKAQGCMREEWVSLSNVVDATIVGAYANAELVYRRYGQVTYDLRPLPYGDAPRLYDDFDLGDKGYLSISAGALQVDRQAVRMFSAVVEVTRGNEVLAQIETAPQ